MKLQRRINKKILVHFLILICLISTSVNATILKEKTDEKSGFGIISEEIVPCGEIGLNSGTDGGIEFRDDQIMLIDGEPFFPIGLWWNEREPWNSINLYSGSPCELNYYDGELMHFYGQDLFEDFTMDKYLDALQCVDHPNFLGWYSVDEPVWQLEKFSPPGFPQYDDLQSYYDLLKEDDPNHPVWMNFCAADISDDRDIWIQKRQQYAQAADIVSVDVYPKGAHPGDEQCACDEDRCVLENPYISVVGDFVDILIDDVVAGQKPVWIVPQAWGDVNEHEIRFQSWQAIIHGATGLFYWHLSTDPWYLVRPDAENVAQELIDMHPVLVAETIDAEVTSTSGIETMVKKVDGNYIILSVNRNPDIPVVTADFDLSSLDITYEGHVEIPRDDMTIAFVDGTFSLNFTPFDTHIIYVYDYDVMVDDDADPEWYNQRRVHTLQDGIDVAVAEDTVFVCEGTYYENVLVNTDLLLLGESQTGTIIDGGGIENVVTISADGVSLEKFTIQNSGRYDLGCLDCFEWWYSGVNVQANDATISENLLTNNYNGIVLYNEDASLSNCIISGNAITQNSNFGIYLWGSSDNQIIENIISTNTYHNIGIQDSINTILVDNRVSFSITGNGIWIKDTSNSNIQENTITYNQLAGITTETSYTSIIQDNTIQNNFNYGISLWDSSDNTLIDNTVTENYYGFYLSNSNFNLIYNNFIHNVKNAVDSGTDNQWFSDYTDEYHLFIGNWWSDYEGVDLNHGPEQGLSGADGIGDSPYSIPGGDSQDRYPWLHPYDPDFPVINLDSGLKYQTIQDAISDPSTQNEHSIFAWNNIYYETLEIDKAINLIGQQREHTIIDGTGPDQVILISTGGVTVSGFTIRNRDGEESVILLIDSSADENTIINNIIEGRYYHQDRGIKIKSSSNNIINNVIQLCLSGISTSYTGSDDTVINRNVIDDNKYGLHIQSSGNSIFENTISNSYSYGIVITKGNNYIYHNNFINQVWQAQDGGSSINYWDNGFPSGGNYWDDYKVQYPDASEIGDSGIWDIPYDILGIHGRQDLYPLIEPWMID